MRNLLFIALLAAVFASCKTPSAPQTQAGPVSLDTLKLVTDEKPVSPRDSLIIAFEKTPCFGRCPVYKIKVFESGFTMYEGLNFAERLGTFSTTLSREKIEKVYELANKTDFFELDSLYNDPYVSDLPSTIVMLSRNGEKKRVVSRINAPEKLNIFIENLAVLLNENEWAVYDLR
jgi:hypothetical protein